MAKTVGDMGDQPIFQLVEGNPPIHPPAETLLILMGEIKKQHDVEYLTLFLWSVSFKEFISLYAF